MRFSIEYKPTERRIAIAEWVTGLMGIFFSVWWGLVFQEIIHKSESDIKLFFLSPKLFQELPLSVFLAACIVYIILFSVYYVHWLWSAQLFSIGRSYQDFRSNSVKFAFSALGVLSGTVFLNLSFPLVSDDLIFFGIAITIAWPVAIGLALFLRR